MASNLTLLTFSDLKNLTECCNNSAELEGCQLDDFYDSALIMQ